MRIFLDANVLVSVLNKEYPHFSFSARIVSLNSNEGYQIFTSPLCLAIAYYFAEKKSRARHAKEKIALLCEHILIADAGRDAVHETLRNKQIDDFEDGLEYYAAMRHKCDCIITENKSDFYFSDIPV